LSVVVKSVAGNAGAVNLLIAAPQASKAVVGVQPGKSGSHVFTSVPANQVVAGEVMVTGVFGDGSGGAATVRASYSGLSCPIG
jgi:hypothetical protein